MKGFPFMEKAIEVALENVITNQGGPFGAIVVKDGKIIGTGRNEVTASNDPTAHAEVQAIREAFQSLNDFQLFDCEIYTSCKTCRCVLEPSIGRDQKLYLLRVCRKILFRK